MTDDGVSTTPNIRLINSRSGGPILQFERLIRVNRTGPLLNLFPLNRRIPCRLKDLHPHGLPAGWFTFGRLSQPVFDVSTCARERCDQAASLFFELPLKQTARKVL